MQSVVETFIRRWQGQEGGQERANYALFLTELCDLLGLPHAQPAAASTEANDYVFERVVREPNRDGAPTRRRIDLYKRDCFVLEAKQSRIFGDKSLRGAAGSAENMLPFPGMEPQTRGRRGAGRAWDVLMRNARAQAEDYVRLLPPDHEPPPFLLVCDVGHCIEIYANFRRDGKAYDIFPDRRTYRIYLEDLRDEAVRKRLVSIWSDPLSLDPARHAAKVTREIATRIAKVSQALEKAGHPTEDVAMFLMRVLFTMFAEDVDLLPRNSFKRLLKDCADRPEIFPGMMEELWRAMDEGGFSATIRHPVRRFNGEFFRNRRALPLRREEIGELAAAADHDWKDVEPAIFGTFLEQALNPGERRRLGAHYTPRAYVERLVIATVIEPLRLEWAGIRATADRQKSEGRERQAIASVQAFHDRLCNLRILDPACGTANFLYVSLELMKTLESDVLEALTDLGGQEALHGLESHTVDPHQFLGLEVNPRAAAIAELVLWIGHLQLHFRNNGGIPSEPILKAFHNIRCMDAVLVSPEDPRRPDWPEADYIVGNPPFIGGKDLRARLGQPYAQALWAAHPHMNESADFVMYWWDRSAELLTRKGSSLKRFGFVTTNSISQVFQRRVMERYLGAKSPLSLVMAIPDHPWTKVTRDSAAVRIAMTVAEAGKLEGQLMQVVSEDGVATDTPVILFRETSGRINADLTTGVDVTAAEGLKGNTGICSPGVKLHGSGFIVTRKEAEHLGRGRHPGLEKHIRNYRNGRDLTNRPRDVMAIDLFGCTQDAVRRLYPEVYQHLLLTVKPERDRNNRATYRDNWWIFGEPRRELRPALAGLSRFVATVETAKHRVFQFLDADVLPDNMLVVIATADPADLGILSSRWHTIWASAQGGTLEDRPRYSKSRCFDPFPFPVLSNTDRQAIGLLGEALDAHRKRVLADHPHLTLTGLYNVLDLIVSGTHPDRLERRDRRVFEDGLLLILKELHDELDTAVAAAYGWPADLAHTDILAHLLALNKERTREEKRGIVRWVRPDYQIERFGSETEKARQIEADLGPALGIAARGSLPPFPSRNDAAQTALVIDALIAAGGAVDAAGIAGRFRQGQRVRPAVASVLASLYRMGLVSTADMGRTFAFRRAA
ncbi:type II restriction/modification system DNA methylase subunit YeeA [Rhizobium sp. PP-F2F-G48]|uniref:class I SAM-dependent DNA methyltransferase n=1 Tax=Rhizobium sp. PP-F2F-G48 TaxID=2135651 RepID=UPI0010538A59|nr:DNA methyltransferase [Rhizobium sp. PP-F2F-G48]TCM58534.1 type II restriction/modification system DNA methylase subunit YeeA [Rhizobium sp. PP-F2F-G48]